MTTTTLTPTSTLEPDAFHAGKADAYDDHRAGTPLDVLGCRLEWMLDHITPTTYSYVLGYGSTYAALRLEDEAVVEAQEALAYEDRALTGRVATENAQGGAW